MRERSLKMYAFATFKLCYISSICSEPYAELVCTLSESRLHLFTMMTDEYVWGSASHVRRICWSTVCEDIHAETRRCEIK